jgi:hypothetical protein
MHHVSYTREAVFDLLPKEIAVAVLEDHRNAESKANLDFSSTQMSFLTHDYAERFPRATRGIYKHAGRLLEWGLRYA